VVELAAAEAELDEELSTELDVELAASEVEADAEGLVDKALVTKPEEGLAVLELGEEELVAELYERVSGMLDVMLVAAL
jgi:hypothetical protein